MLNKILGGLMGMAIGDALGGTTEFLSEKQIKEKYGVVTDIIGGGYWHLIPGETTDDTAMTIAVAKGIIDVPNDPIQAIGKYFIEWNNTNPKDIGNIVATSFRYFSGDWNFAAKRAHDILNGKTAGNGSLMRCLPIALAYNDLEKMQEITIKQSKMTHYDDVAAEICVIYNKIAMRLLNGENLQASILKEVKNTRFDSNLEIKPDCSPNGYVVNTFTWVLYWLYNMTSFSDVVIGAANKGGDSDTIAAIAGGLKGIEVGFSGIPLAYSNKILLKDELMNIGKKLYSIKGMQIN